uniref:Uncharacterized protein n=1 Tax=viral metagenome TaxID=1070528 RepID=A0A6C0EFG6_9ZZZZ
MTIGAAAFSGCEQLRNVTIKDNEFFKKIEPDTFCGCKNITSIIIPQNIEIIGSLAFDQCSNLEFIYIHNPNIKLGVLDPDTNVKVFQGCDNLKEIHFSSNTSIDHKQKIKTFFVRIEEIEEIEVIEVIEEIENDDWEVVGARQPKLFFDL